MPDNFPSLANLNLNLTASKAALAAVAGISSLVLLHSLTKKPKHPLPPGPPGKPVVGNFLDLPEKEGWHLPELYRDLGRTFNSDLVYANLCGAHVVVVNTAEAAHELFQVRANIYSERPQLNALRKILGIEWLAAILPPGDEWKDIRHAFGAYFKTPEYRDVETRSAHSLLRSILEKPDDFLAHFRRMNTATTMAITYGIDVAPGENEQYVGIGERVLQALVYGTSLFALAFDAVPALVKTPSWLLKYKSDAKEGAGHAKDMLEVPFKHVQDAIAEGKAKPSIVANMLSNAQTPRDEELAKLNGANIYFSGVNNMNSALGGFIMAMAKYPEAQRLAQKELDEIVGNARLPEFADQPSLRYVDALVKEVFRWHPVTPLAIPHAAGQDDVYKGYLIPKGSVVIPNSWAMLHDENTYPEPESFKPERWLAKPGDFPFAAFGFGRRLCPGLAYSRDHIWIAVASILAAYDIAPAVDAQGQPIPLTEEYSPTLFSFPVPFQVQITPRSLAAKQAILATAMEEPLTA